MKIVGWFMGASIAAYVMMGAAAVLGVGLMLLAPSAGASTAARSVCDTGFRGQPAYDRACLVKGSAGDAGVAWYVGYTDGQRKADCRSVKRLGGMRNVVRRRAATCSWTTSATMRTCSAGRRSRARPTARRGVIASRSPWFGASRSGGQCST